MNRSTRERETVLVVGSDAPEGVVRHIAGLTSIGNYRLLPRPSRSIHDLYYDAPIGFRLRQCNGKFWLCLKGPSRRTAGGGVERREMEVRWSKSGLATISTELKNRGIDLGLPAEVNYDRPFAVLKRLGLKVIQDRENRRIIRNIVRAGDKKRSVRAELAIDSVVYHFSKQNVRLYEVEIESKSKAGTAVATAVAKTLVKRFRPLLRPWPHGKLVTGLAIERLLAAGALEGLVDAGGTLLPAAWDKIKTQFSQGV